MNKNFLCLGCLPMSNGQQSTPDEQEHEKLLAYRSELAQSRKDGGLAPLFWMKTTD